MALGFGLILLCGFAVVTAAFPNDFYAPETITVERNPPDPNLMFCAFIAENISLCIAQNNFPYCNGTQSPLQKCVSVLQPKLSKCNYPLITSALLERIRILNISANILCKSGLYKVFPKDLNCWALAKAGLIASSALAKGLLTDDGCRINKINRDIIIGFGYNYPKCSDHLTTYLLPLFKASVCGYIEHDF